MSITILELRFEGLGGYQMKDRTFQAEQPASVMSRKEHVKN